MATSIAISRREPRIETGVARLAYDVRVARGGYELIEQIANEWRALLSERVDDRPSLWPEWFCAHLRERQPEMNVILFTAYRDGRLRGALPLIADRVRFHGVPLRWWRGANIGDSSDPLDVIHGAGDGPAVTRAIWEAISKERGWDLLQLADIASDSSISAFLSHARNAGFPSDSRPARTTPILELPAGGDFAAASGHVNAKFRATVRRKKRKLEAKGVVTFERYTTADPVILDKFFTMEASGWKGRAGTDINSLRGERAYYISIAEAAEQRGDLSIYSLEVDGEPIAMHLGLTVGGRYMLPKVAFYEEWSEFSPGQIIQHEILRDCAERGVREIDFMGQPGEWKRRWATGERTYDRYFIFRKTPQGLAAYSFRFLMLPPFRPIAQRFGWVQPNGPDLGITREMVDGAAD